MKFLCLASVLAFPAPMAAQTIGAPELFAPGVVSTGDDYTHSLSITPDGKRVYFTRQVGREGPFIFMSDLNDGVWQAAALAPFNGAYGGDYQTLSPDGLRLWFCSRRPANGDTTRAAIRATQSDLFLFQLAA